MTSEGSTAKSPNGEARAANAINTTMFALLALLAFGLAIWMFNREISPVGAIYRSLSVAQQRHLTVFGSSLAMIVLGLSLTLRATADWLKRRRAAT
jgi:hypothetical protein